MFENIFQILLAIGLLKGTFERNLDVKTLMDIENILRSVDQNVDDPDDVPYLQERNDDYRNIDDDDGEDLIDINALNSFIKRITDNQDNNEFNDDDYDRFLRNANENLCRKIGRCGCGQAAGRCGKTSVSNQQTVDEIQRLIDDLDDRVNRDDDRDTGDRDNTRYDNDDNEHHLDNHLNIVRDEDDETNDANYVNRIHDKVHSPNNRLDLVAINDLSDLGKLFKQNDKSDKMDNLNKQRYGNFEHRSARIKNNQNNVKAIIVDLSRFYNESGLSDVNGDLQRSVGESKESANPEEFSQHFNTLKEKVIKNFVDFITHKNAKRPNLSTLTNTQKRKIRILKGKMRTNRENLSQNEVKREVNDILFGKYSVIKFVPSEDNSNNIVVPKWVYKLIISTKPKPLRTPKRILPLTYKQRKLLYNKNLNQSRGPAISRVWRRSVDQDLQRYGVPFELAVQGLAQYNED